MKKLPLLLFLFTLATSHAAEVEKEYVIDFATNSLNLPTSYPASDAEMPLEFILDNGAVFALENAGVRYNPNSGYNCLQISNAGSGAKMYGCFSLTAPKNGKITYIDFIGRDPGSTKNCRDLLSGPFSNPDDSSSEAMTEAWIDSEGREKLFFKYVYNPSAVGSAFISQIRYKILIKDNNQEEEPDPKPDLKELMFPVIGLINNVPSTDDDQPYVCPEQEEFSIGIFSMNMDTNSYQLFSADAFIENTSFKTTDGGDASYSFNVAKLGSILNIITEEAGSYSLECNWTDSSDYLAGEAKMTLVVYPIDNLIEEIIEGNVTVKSENGTILSPQWNEHENRYVIPVRKEESGETPRVRISNPFGTDIEIYYLTRMITGSESTTKFLETINGEKDWNPMVVPENMQLYDYGFIELPGSKGSISFSIKKNGVFSKSNTIYYEVENAPEKDPSVGISETISDIYEEVYGFDGLHQNHSYSGKPMIIKKGGKYQKVIIR